MVIPLNAKGWGRIAWGERKSEEFHLDMSHLQCPLNICMIMWRKQFSGTLERDECLRYEFENDQQIGGI